MSEANKFLDISELSYAEFHGLAQKTKEERLASLSTKNKAKWTTEEVLRIEPMSFVEEASAVLMFFFGVPGSVYTLPILLALIYCICGAMYAAIGACILLPLVFIRVPYSENALLSWFSQQIVRYFSFKVIYSAPLKENTPYILVAPPHGVFPFGNITTMISFPSVMGYSFKGLASSAAFWVPVFGQMLSSIGVIDASRHSATAALRKGHTVGISTGGVAEVFETDTVTGDEAVVLRNRKGLVKLAIRTGAALVPCYLFGNTRLFSLYTGHGWMRKLLRNLSRKLGFATILFWGRFFLPIPYRTPIVGVMAKPIPVVQCDNPTNEDIDKLHEQLLIAMQQLFDEHKEAYGWGDKKLLIK